MSKASFSPPPSKKRKLDTDEIDTLSPISRVMHFVNSDTNDADYFSILQLPSPTVDALDRLTWSAPKHDIRKQYLRISRQVHPDRFVGDDAQSKRAAHCFDLVHTAYRTLADDVEREQYLSAFQTRNGQKLKDDEEEDESGCTNDLRNPNSQFKRKQSRRRKMMEQEADEYAKQVMNEFHQRRMRSKMKQVRTEQQQRRDMQNKTQSSTVCDNEECDSAEDDIDIMKTLTKLKRKQKQKKRF